MFMKNILLISLCVLFVQSCKTKKEESNIIPNESTSEITFGIKVHNNAGFENDIMPWISIKNAESEIENLIGKDEIVIENNIATIIIDYPLNNPVEIEIQSNTSKGFTRKQLAEKISEEYKRIYKEEDESTKIQTTPIDERKGIINRNQTDGKYGIWGHDIDDLDLSRVIIKKTDSGKIKLELIVES